MLIGNVCSEKDSLSLNLKVYLPLSLGLSELFWSKFVVCLEMVINFSPIYIHLQNHRQISTKLGYKHPWLCSHWTKSLCSVSCSISFLNKWSPCERLRNSSVRLILSWIMLWALCQRVSMFSNSFDLCRAAEWPSHYFHLFSLLRRDKFFNWRINYT